VLMESTLFSECDVVHIQFSGSGIRGVSRSWVNDYTRLDGLVQDLQVAGQVYMGWRRTGTGT
jgi:hypothetical protein